MLIKPGSKARKVTHSRWQTMASVPFTSQEEGSQLIRASFQFPGGQNAVAILREPEKEIRWIIFLMSWGPGNVLITAILLSASTMSNLYGLVFIWPTRNRCMDQCNKAIWTAWKIGQNLSMGATWTGSEVFKKINFHKSAVVSYTVMLSNSWQVWRLEPVGI